MSNYSTIFASPSHPSIHRLSIMMIVRRWSMANNNNSSSHSFILLLARAASIIPGSVVWLRNWSNKQRNVCITIADPLLHHHQVQTVQINPQVAITICLIKLSAACLSNRSGLIKLILIHQELASQSVSQSLSLPIAGGSFFYCCCICCRFEITKRRSFNSNLRYFQSLPPPIKSTRECVGSLLKDLSWLRECVCLPQFD